MLLKESELLERISNKATGVLNLSNRNMQVIIFLIQLLSSIAFNFMNSFLSLFINTELNYVLIEATAWAGICMLIASSLNALTAPFWGFMCDRSGTKIVLLISLAGSMVAYAGMTVSNNAPIFVLFQGLKGIFGPVSTVMFTLIALIISQDKLKMALSYQVAALTMGQLIGPGLGGILVSLFGYRLTLVTAAAVYAGMIPLVLLLRLPTPTSQKGEQRQFTKEDLKAIMPDTISLILVYASISFIVPTVPWFLQSLGVPSIQLVTLTAITTILNGLAFGLASPILTKVTTGRRLPLLSVISALAIFTTNFASSPYLFITLRVIIGSIQAGIPANLLGGKSGRKGTAMGILNSARFIGLAIGPYTATSILGDGTAPRPLYMYATMAVISLFTAAFIYLTHTQKTSKQVPQKTET
ncbi:MAG: transporter, family, multidrug resistance protein [Thermoproteota archaeon]|nr:transporter, family, multidrug resistance protein [Thermoproteota archaeon]